MKKESKPCTLKDLGFSFTFDENCSTCGEGQCHNIVKCQIKDKECNVHVTADPACGTYTIVVFDFESGEKIEEPIIYSSNTETAVYLRDRFNFTCA